MATLTDVTTALTTATPDAVQAEAQGVVNDALNDLVAGKSPFESKTEISNMIILVAGIAGTAYTAYAQGGTAAMIACLGVTGSAIFNMILRFFTNGPLVTDGLKAIINALCKLTPQKITVAPTPPPAPPAPTGPVGLNP